MDTQGSTTKDKMLITIYFKNSRTMKKTHMQFLLFTKAQLITKSIKPALLFGPFSRLI